MESNYQSIHQMPGFIWRATTKAVVTTTISVMSGFAGLNYLPNSWVKELYSGRIFDIASIVKIPFQALQTQFFPLYPSNSSYLYPNLGRGLIVGLGYYGIIQQIILKKLPEQTLNKIAPQYQHLIDHKITKTMRIALVALLMTLANSGPDIPNSGCFAAIMMARVIYGYWVENGSSLKELSAITAINIVMLEILFPSNNRWYG